MNKDVASRRLAVVVPTYPSEDNMYLCAFVHSRVKAYLQAGIDVEVLCVWDYYEDHTEYEIEGVHVTRLIPGSLEAHLFLWSHNPETRYWDWPLFTTPYFTHPAKLTHEQTEEFTKRDAVIRQLNNQSNVSWVFVSETLKKRSEELIGIHFNRAHVISNLVDEKVYQFSKRNKETRHKVIVVRKFDNVNTYAIDINVQAIVELSKRRIFKDLTFDIYGSGPMFENLTEPIKDFENVNLHEHFLSQSELKEAYDNHGIGLFATRFDSQGVSMCEAAMSGMPVVSSNIDAANYFLPNDIGLLCDVENPCEYADVVEKLARNRWYYNKCAKACRQKIEKRCSRAQTVEKEIDLFWRSI